MNEMIAEGAEAKIIKVDENTLLKVRGEKPYRLKVIDEKLRKFRTKREFKVLTKLNEWNINAPIPLYLKDKEFSFTMEYINGKVLKEVLNKELLDKAFEQIIAMHSRDVVHGDLTTLNMIVKENEVYLIDFGLAEFSKKIEDKAVDLNLFFTCIKNEHPDYYKFKPELCKKYEANEFGHKVLVRLENVEQRGRNK